MNSEENQGFLGRFLAVFDPDSSHMLHMDKNKTMLVYNRYKDVRPGTASFKLQL